MLLNICSTCLPLSSVSLYGFIVSCLYIYNKVNSRRIYLFPDYHLSVFQILSNVFLDAFCNVVAVRGFYEFLTYDMFIKFYVSFADTVDVFVCHLRNSLSWLVHKVILYEPLTYKFL